MRRGRWVWLPGAARGCASARTPPPPGTGRPGMEGGVQSGIPGEGTEAHKEAVPATVTSPSPPDGIPRPFACVLRPTHSRIRGGGAASKGRRFNPWSGDQPERRGPLRQGGVGCRARRSGSPGGVSAAPAIVPGLGVGHPAGCKDGGVQVCPAPEGVWWVGLLPQIARREVGSPPAPRDIEEYGLVPAGGSAEAGLGEWSAHRSGPRLLGPSATDRTGNPAPGTEAILLQGLRPVAPPPSAKASSTMPALPSCFPPPWPDPRVRIQGIGAPASPPHPPPPPSGGGRRSTVRSSVRRVSRKDARRSSASGGGASDRFGLSPAGTATSRPCGQSGTHRRNRFASRKGGALSPAGDGFSAPGRRRPALRHWPPGGGWPPPPRVPPRRSVSHPFPCAPGGRSRADGPAPWSPAARRAPILWARDRRGNPESPSATSSPPPGPGWPGPPGGDPADRFVRQEGMGGGGGGADVSQSHPVTPWRP